MTFRITTPCIVTIALALSLFQQGLSQSADTQTRTLVVFFDGLRPDYITAETMPNLYAFAKAGSYGRQHHSVYPTVTRVNASSYSSGSYPETHGILCNTVYFPEVNRVKGLSTGSYEELSKIQQATHGNLLTSITLGEVLGKHNQRMIVFSSGSEGQAFLQNHTISGGAIVNPVLILPESFRDKVIREVGPIPAKADVSTAAHQWITDALIKFGLADDGPLVSSIWYSDPDGIAHEVGIGETASMESIRIVDAEFGRIIEFLKSRNLTDKFNIIVSTDHGFITHTGNMELEAFLIAKGLKKAKGNDEVIVADGAIYVTNHDQGLIKKIVSALQQEPWVGPIFTKGKGKSSEGSVSGTLSLASVHWDHPTRAADILVSYNWNDNKNSKGFSGTDLAPGVAGHGGLSPYEVNVALLAKGPAFKEAYTSELPTSNVDIVPTVLAIHKLPVPKEMTGRVIRELLAEEKGENEKPRIEETIVTNTIPGGHYKATLQRTILGHHAYIDKATATRVIK